MSCLQKQCSQQRNDVKDAAIVDPESDLCFRLETTNQVRGSEVSTHHNDASKKEKRHPRAPSPLAPTEEGQDFHPNCRTPATQPTGMGHTVHVSSLRRRRSTSQKEPHHHRITRRGRNSLAGGCSLRAHASHLQNWAPWPKTATRWPKPHGPAAHRQSRHSSTPSLPRSRAHHHQARTPPATKEPPCSHTT